MLTRYASAHADTGFYLIGRGGAFLGGDGEQSSGVGSGGGGGGGRLGQGLARQRPEAVEQVINTSAPCFAPAKVKGASRTPSPPPRPIGLNKG